MPGKGWLWSIYIFIWWPCHSSLNLQGCQRKCLSDWEGVICWVTCVTYDSVELGSRGVWGRAEGWRESHVEHSVTLDLTVPRVVSDNEVIITAVVVIIMTFFWKFDLTLSLLSHLGARHFRWRDDGERGRHSTCSGGPSGAAQIHGLKSRLLHLFGSMKRSLLVFLLVKFPLWFSTVTNMSSAPIGALYVREGIHEKAFTFGHYHHRYFFCHKSLFWRPKKRTKLHKLGLIWAMPESKWLCSWIPSLIMHHYISTPNQATSVNFHSAQRHSVITVAKTHKTIIILRSVPTSEEVLVITYSYYF